MDSSSPVRVCGVRCRVNLPSNPFVSNDHPLSFDGEKENGQNHAITLPQRKKMIAVEPLRATNITRSHALLEILPDPNVVRKLLPLNSNSKTIRAIEIASGVPGAVEQGLVSLNFPAFDRCRIDCETPDRAD